MIKTGIIAASLFAIAAFIYYQYIYVTTGIKPNEIYFLSGTISIAALFFLVIRKEHSVFIKLFPIMAGTFFLSVSYLYIRRWIMEGSPSTNYYTALCISTGVTFFYILTYGIISIIKSQLFKHN